MNLLLGVFDSVVNFFDSIRTFLSFDMLFYIAAGIEFIILIALFIGMRKSFEIQMVKAIDVINVFLATNPKINDDNLVAFNDKMKKVPLALRTQWQQFMLYRENNASYYMSFKKCVENPIKTNSFKQNLKNITLLIWILTGITFLLSVFIGIDQTILRFSKNVIILPAMILMIYYIINLFSKARLNAITSDLYQNFQYFEKNIDKATVSLPDYVDYEVLFTRKEIKQGIPVLFEYLEKRAQIEQEELEKARQKNIEHEKYNFDKAGIDNSLVLERAMSEAERYLAERGHYLKEIERADNEIGVIEAKQKDYTKEYQRKIQAGKENLERLKLQLEQSASNIEANYIKKQQADEIQRQQLLEREYDNVTNKYRLDIAALQKEIDDKNNRINKLRTILEEQMMSEFDTYSKKVYDKVEDAVAKQQSKRFSNMDQARVEAEERLAEKERDLEKIYTQYQVQTERLDRRNVEFDEMLRKKNQEITELKQSVVQIDKTDKKNAKRSISLDEELSQKDIMPDNFGKEIKLDDLPLDLNKVKENKNVKKAKHEETILDNIFGTPKEEKLSKDEKIAKATEPFDATEKLRQDFLALQSGFKGKKENTQKDDEDATLLNKLYKENKTDTQDEEDEDIVEEYDKPETVEDDSNKDSKAADDDNDDADDNGDDGANINWLDVLNKLPENKTAKKRGRPKKTDTTTKEAKIQKTSKGRGRPRKTDVPKPIQTEPKRGRGRPKKTETELALKAKPVTKNIKAESSQPAESIQRKRGRPPKKVDFTKEKKETIKEVKPANEQITGEPKRGRGRPKKNVAPSEISAITAEPKRGRGRPRKTEQPDGAQTDDIDKQLKALSAMIKAENKNLDKAKKLLDNEISKGFDGEQIQQKRKQNQEKQDLLDGIIDKLAHVSHSAITATKSDKPTIKSSIADISKNLKKLKSKK